MSELIDIYKKVVLQNYLTFSGRTGRREFWLFFVENLIISLILSLIFPPLSFIYSLAVLLPNLALGIRRLHDTDRSGWWLLIGLVPLIGAIVLIVFFAMDSQHSDNRFGAYAAPAVPSQPVQPAAPSDQGPSAPTATI